MRGARLERTLQARLHRVDRDDDGGAGEPEPLDHELADAAGAEHEGGLTGLDARGIAHGPEAGEGGAAEHRRSDRRHLRRQAERGSGRHEHVLGERADGKRAKHLLATGCDA